MKNIHRFLFIFALSRIVQCEVKDIKIWGNTDPSGNIWSTSGNTGHNGNIWSSLGNSGQGSNIWSNSEQNGDAWSNIGNSGQNGNIWSSSRNNGQSSNIWSNSGNKGKKDNTLNNGPSMYNYASKFRDNNVDYGHKVQNGNADVWFSSSWGTNNLTDIQQRYGNDWNQIQSSWNSEQGSQPQPITTPEPNVPITTTEQPVSSTAAPSPGGNNGNYYVPQTNFYQTNPNEAPKDIQSAIQQFPVTDLTQIQDNVPQNDPSTDISSTLEQFPFIVLTQAQYNTPQTEPIVMTNNTQENIPQKQILPIESSQSTSVPDMQEAGEQPNLVQLPMFQQFIQSPQFLSNIKPQLVQNPAPSAQVFNFKNQQNQVEIPSGNTQQFVPWQYLQLNSQIPVNYPYVQQNPLPNNRPFVYANKEQFNSPANIQQNTISHFVGLLPPFSSNKPNGNFHGNNQVNSQNFPVLNAPSLITIPNYHVNSHQTLMNSSPSAQAANIGTLEKREAPLPSLNPENIKILNSSPLIRAPVSQINSHQTPFDSVSSNQSKFPVVSQQNLPQAQLLQRHNTFMSQLNSPQQQINLPVHPGYNYRPNGNQWMNTIHQVPNSIDADTVSKKVKRSYEVYEHDTDIDHDLINRMWLNGHGYPTGEGRNFITSNKNTDVVETTTQKEIVSDVPLNNSKIVDLNKV